MIDVLNSHGMTMDMDGLAAALKVPVVAISAKSGLGLDNLQELIAIIAKPCQRLCLAMCCPMRYDCTRRFMVHRQAQQLAASFGPKGDLLINSQTRLDQFFLHSWFGGISFVLIMFLLFQSIFTWAAPIMDGVEAILQFAASVVIPLLPAGAISDFVSDALFGGIGAFLVFVPQIFILTLVVGMLEDSGYLARAAVICHKPLRIFGLTGKSFIPMLSSVACAIPGIYAARTVDSPRKRWLTYLAIPLNALLCSTAGVQSADRCVYSRHRRLWRSDWLAGFGHGQHLSFWHSLRSLSHGSGIPSQCGTAN